MTMTTKDQIDQRRWAAKKTWIFKRDRAAASTEALEALELLATADARGSELAELHHNMAALFRELGDVARCEPLARRALELELSDKRDDYTLGNYYLFLAKLLDEQGQHGEATTLARHGLAAFERAWAPNYPELAVIREEVAKIVAAGN